MSKLHNRRGPRAQHETRSGRELMEDKSESPEYIHEVAVARRGQALSDKKRDAEITKDSRDNLKR